VTRYGFHTGVLFPQRNTSRRIKRICTARAKFRDRKTECVIMPAHSEAFIKDAHAIFLLSGGTGPYREIRRRRNCSRGYVARGASSASTGCIHHSGGVHTRHHNDLVHYLGAVLRPQGQAKGNGDLNCCAVCFSRSLSITVCGERARR